MKIGNSKASESFFTTTGFGVKKAYESDKMVRLVVDAFYKLLTTTNINTVARKSGASTLFQILLIQNSYLIKKIEHLLLGEQGIDYDSDDRHLPSLYALEFSFELVSRFLVGATCQYILDPNSEKEYLFIALRFGVAVKNKSGSPFKIGGELKKLDQTLQDFANFNVAFGAEAEWSRKFGPFKLKVKLVSSAPKLGAPRLFMGFDEIAQRLKLRGDASDRKKAGVELKVFEWDLGFVVITASYDVRYEDLKEKKEDSEAGLSAKAYAELQFFFSADTAVFDDLIYVDLIKQRPNYYALP